MTMYELPYGNTQQLNLDWFIKRWQEFYTQWQETEADIDHELDAEVQRVEDAMTDLYAARDAAAASATAAAASAASASNDATIAANAATAAAASATLANTKATAAGLSEAAAAFSASQAANDATAAATSASQASASASSATDSAQAAAASATAADSSADDAADSATAAAGSASDAADSATAAAASAASLVVDSAMSDSSTNPVQNKVINGELTELKTALSVLEPTATSADVGKALIAKTVADGKVTEYEFGEAGGGASAIVNSVENVAIASFDDGTESAIKQIVVGIEPYQAGSGDASPENQRPIYGWTQAKINTAAINLIDMASPEKNGYYIANGTYTSSSLYSCYLVPVKPNTTYTTIGGFAEIVTFWDKNIEFVSGINQGADRTYTFTTPDNCYYFRRSILKADIDGTQMVVLGSSVPTYEAYKGAVYPITFPTEAGTVYGGTLTINEDGSGELSARRVTHELNGTENFGVTDLGGSSQRFSKQISSLGWEATATFKDETSSHFLVAETGQGNSSPFGKFYISTYLVFSDSGNVFESASDFNQWLATQYSNGTPVQISYNIATPTTYQLTAQQVITLLDGVNNVWADTGNINLLQYYADSKKYIDEQDTLIKALIAPVLDGMVADTALTVNDFRIVYNTLYRITAPVAAGAALTPNTNCAATTISAILKTLLT